MERIQTTLAPGVELVACRTEQFKTGVLSVTLTVPLREETATAYAMIPEVLYRGSRLHPDIEQLSAATDQLYGASLGPSVRQRGESQGISFLCSVIDDRYALDGMAVLEPAAMLMGEILLDPAVEGGVFRADYVQSEGANLADRINARINDKQDWAIFRLTQEMCAGEAYALDKLGSAQQALEMTPEVLWEHYQTLLAQAQVVFYYSGSAPWDRVEQVVRQAFAPLITPRQRGYTCQVVERPAGSVRRITERMEVGQAKLALGFRIGGITMGHPQFPALLVCNALFGGTANSKLFLRVREELSLCYSVSSLLDKLKGIMVVPAGVDAADLNRAEQAILEQLEEIRRGQFTQEELEAARMAVRSGLRSARDSQGRMEDDCVTRQLATGTPEGSQALLEAVEQVTAQQVEQAAHAFVLDTVYCLTGKEGE